MNSAIRRGKPHYSRGIPATWWYERAKAEKVEQKG